MRSIRTYLAAGLFLVGLSAAAPARAQATAGTADGNLAMEKADVAAIEALMAKGVSDWNKGDLPAFESTYKNAPDIVFMGGTVRRGFDGMVQSYNRNYPTAEKRGVLTYTGLEVHVLDPRYAYMIGRFHLERTPAGGGNADGEFSLLWEKTAAGWKIILDHTGSSAPPKAATASNP